jgi:hypothetical protein
MLKELYQGVPYGVVSKAEWGESGCLYDSQNLDAFLQEHRLTFGYQGLKGIFVQGPSGKEAGNGEALGWSCGSEAMEIVFNYENPADYKFLFVWFSLMASRVAQCTRDGDEVLFGIHEFHPAEALNMLNQRWPSIKAQPGKFKTIWFTNYSGNLKPSTGAAMAQPQLGEPEIKFVEMNAKILELKKEQNRISPIDPENVASVGYNEFKETFEYLWNHADSDPRMPDHYR